MTATERKGKAVMTNQTADHGMAWHGVDRGQTQAQHQRHDVGPSRRVTIDEVGFPFFFCCCCWCLCYSSRACRAQGTGQRLRHGLRVHHASRDEQRLGWARLGGAGVKSACALAGRAYVPRSQPARCDRRRLIAPGMVSVWGRG